jgi:hypothetical protein
MGGKPMMRLAHFTGYAPCTPKFGDTINNSFYNYMTALPLVRGEASWKRREEGAI